MLNDVKPERLDMNVEVVIPVLNGAETIALAIESALRQTVPFYRITVVDQCSTDQTASIVKGYPQVRYRLNRESHSPCENWNAAVSIAESDFVCVLHADDVLLPRWNEQCQRLLRKAPDPLHTCLFIGGAEFRAPHHLSAVHLFADSSQVYDRGGLLKVLWKRVFYGLKASANMLYSRRVFQEFGGFPTGEFAAMGDVPLHLRMLTQIPLGYVAEPLILMRVGDKGRLSLKRRDELARGAFLAMEGVADKLADVMGVNVSRVKADYAYPYWVMHTLSRCGVAAWDVPEEVAQKASFWVREAGLVWMIRHSFNFVCEGIRRDWLLRKYRKKLDRWLCDFIRVLPEANKKEGPIPGKEGVL